MDRARRRPRELSPLPLREGAIRASAAREDWGRGTFAAPSPARTLPRSRAPSREGRGEPKRRVLSGSFAQSAHGQIFDLQEVLDAVFGAFAADAGFLHAAERRHFGGDKAFVDADDAVFQRFRHAPDAT